MKKTFIILLLITTVLVLSQSTFAVLNTSSSPYKNKYSAPTGYTYLGYETVTKYGAWNDTTSIIEYYDIYYKTPFNVQYGGLLGTLQNTFYKDPTTVMSGDNFGVTKMSFTMSQQMTHTFAIGLGLESTVENSLYNFESTNSQALIATVWKKVTSKQRSTKITTDVGPNIDGAPYVSMVIYTISSDVIVVVHEAKATRNWIWESWSSFKYSGSVIHPKRQIRLGYAAFYTFIGDGNDNDYKSGQYLIDNNPNFPSNQFQSKSGMYI